jgi:hypothetical protein
MKIKDFLYIQNIVGQEEISNIYDERVIFLLSYFTGIPLKELESYDIVKYNKLFLKNKHKFQYQPKNSPTKWFYFDKNIWIKKDVKELVWGDFVDLYKFCQKPFDKNNLNFIILKMYKPYFDIKEIPNFENLNIDNVYYSIQEAVKFVADKMEKYKTLFKTDKKEEGNSAYNKKKDLWGMLNVTFSVIDEDPLKIVEINKMNIDTLFIFLIWQKQKNDEMMREMEKSKLKR